MLSRFFAVVLVPVLAVILIPSPAHASPVPGPLAASSPLAVMLIPSPAHAAVAAESLATLYVTTTPWPSLYGSLSSVARAVCGDSGTWQTIAQDNGIVDPRRLRIGVRLKVTCATTRSAQPVASRSTTHTTAWVHPVPGARCSSGYGPRWGRTHEGVDLVRPAGTPIRAAYAGTVVRAGWWSSGYGISVLLSHGDLTWTHYAHASREVVSIGQQVSAGQVIAYVGSTGNSTGPHLHYEVWSGWWNQINPTPYMAARGIGTGC